MEAYYQRNYRERGTMDARGRANVLLVALGLDGEDLWIANHRIICMDDASNLEDDKIIEHKLLLQLHIYDRIKIIDWHNAE